MVDAGYFYKTMANEAILPFQMHAQKYTNPVDFMAELKIDSIPARARIVNLMCTIAPPCRDLQMLEDMIIAGMSIARINLSYCSSQEWLVETIQMIRQAEANVNAVHGIGTVVAIGIDLRGPEIRTGLLDNDIDVEIHKGDTLKLTTDKAYMLKGNCNTIYIDYDNILKVVQPEDRIYINNGTLVLTVTGIHGSNIIANVECGALMGSRKTCFLPGIRVDLPILTKQDREDILVSVQLGINFIFASFVRNAKDMQIVKKFVRDHPDVKVIAKIETVLAVQNFDEILDVSDAIYINRQYLGIELPMHKLFLVQKSIIAKCCQRAIGVICGRPVLESLTGSLLVSRCDLTDIANMILEGADGIHVSETAALEDPTKHIQLAAKVTLEAEAAVNHRQYWKDLCQNLHGRDRIKIIALTAVSTAVYLNAAAIVALVRTGNLVHNLSKFKSRIPIIAVVHDKQKARELLLYRGVYPVLYDPYHDSVTPKSNWAQYVDNQLNYGILIGKVRKFIYSGDPIVMVYGTTMDASTDTVRVEYVSDIVEKISY